MTSATAKTRISVARSVPRPSAPGDRSTLGAVTAAVLVVYYAVIFVVPFGTAIWLSLQNWDFIDDHVFVGLHNYKRALTDPYFWEALKTTVLFSVVDLAIGISVSLVLAYLLSRINGLPQRILLSLYYLPVMIPTVVTVVLWQLLYLPNGGVFNGVLSWAGLPAQQFLNSPSQALWCVTAMIIWAELGTGLVLFLAGITSIPTSLFEAAELDGAGAVRQFRHVAVPLLRPIIFYQIVVSIIGLVQMFTQFQLLPGPGFATRTLSVYTYQLGFQSVDLGYGAALSVIIFLILLTATLIQFRRNKIAWED